MKVLTVISDPNHTGFKDALMVSCKFNNLSLVALQFKNEESLWNNRVKDSVLKDYLINLDENDIIMFVDGYDSILLAQPEEILRTYDLFKSDLVFSTEINCWPDKHLADEYKHNADSGPFKYLNSGGFIGRVGTILKFLVEDQFGVDVNYQTSNQYVWTKRYLTNSGIISLDTDCLIFSTLCPPLINPMAVMTSSEHNENWFNENFSISKKDKRIYNTITKSWPCCAHFNGWAKTIFTSKVDEIFES